VAQRGLATNSALPLPEITHHTHPPTNQAKAKVLREAIFKINQKHGANTVMQMTGGFADV
jgi:hypothetical protein